MRNKLSNLVWGLILVFIGVGIAGDVFDLWEFNPFFPGFLTLVIIIPCAISMISGGINIGNTIGLVIGLLILIYRNVHFDFDIWKLIMPAVLILIGLSIMLKGAFRKTINFGPGNGPEAQSYKSSSAKSEYSAVFSSNRVHVTEQFTGTNLSAIFGGIELDLRDAVISSDVVIDATAVFGGIDIFLPNGVSVKVNNVPIFGGVSNKSGRQAVPGSPVIYLNSTCMFGGIDIK